MDMRHCDLCPRMCGVNRGETPGFCGCGLRIKAARAALHHWEEPCISGSRGSGTVFFSGCALRCCFCQNHAVSSGNFGLEISPDRLSRIFLELQDKGAHNINLVTATQYLPLVIEALDMAKPRLHLPVVYNSSGYERVETVNALRGYVDIWLPDLKYYSPSASARYSGAPDYFEVASKAVAAMVRQSGEPRFSEKEGVRLMTRGTIIRHMVLPGNREDSLRLIDWMKTNLPLHQYYISLLCQYTPAYQSSLRPEIHRRVTSYEYQKVVEAALAAGMTEGFMQKKSSAKEEYTPPFDLEGILP